MADFLSKTESSATISSADPLQEREREREREKMKEREKEKERESERGDRKSVVRESARKCAGQRERERRP